MSKYMGILLGITLLLVFGCEGISVSVNKDGEIAIPREEGIVIYNPVSGDVRIFQQNENKNEIPVLTAWNADGNALAYTLRPKKGNKSTSLFIRKKREDAPKLIYSSKYPISQIRWSPAGDAVSIARQGVSIQYKSADIALIDVNTGKVLKEFLSVGDSHAWLDKNSLIYVKIKDVNPDNAAIYKGTLTLYNRLLDEELPLTEVLFSREGSITADPFHRQIGFTAIEAGPQVGPYTDFMSDENFAYIIKPGNFPEIIYSEPVTFLLFSPDGTRLLGKRKEWDDSDLILINWRLKTAQTVQESVPDFISTDSMKIPLYPAWYDSRSLVYFSIHYKYGANGKDLRLMHLDLITEKKRDLQLAVDQGVQ